MKECPKHPNALIIKAWKYCPFCGSALIESIAGMPVVTSPAVYGMLIVSTETRKRVLIKYWMRVDP